MRGRFSRARPDPSKTGFLESRSVQGTSLYRAWLSDPKLTETVEIAGAGTSGARFFPARANSLADEAEP